jgi:hypothetical protein
MSKKAVLPALGEGFEGGFFGGEITINGDRYALVVAPKIAGEKINLQHKKKKLDTFDGTDLDDDGFYNSCQISDANHPAAQFCRSLQIAGHDDWYLPSRDELMIIWMALGPNRKNTPEAFRAGSPEAFADAWYWSSTEYAQFSDGAWVVGFGGGFQDINVKSLSTGVRAVRRFKI